MDQKDEETTESQTSENELIEKNIFTPREYQVEILEIAKEKNTIACLGTGTGKTFIAVMLIRHYANQTLGDYDRAKRTVFLVPTVPLVNQQAEVIRKHIDLNVGEYFGEKDIDFSKDQWSQEFEKNNILVMVAEVFRLIIQHALLAMSKINLIVIDECHRAVKNHPYREALKCLDVCDPRNRPRILGLTAPLINGKCKPYQLEGRIENLERTMFSSVATPEDILSLKEFGTDPIEIIKEYQYFRSPYEIFNEIVKILNCIIVQFSKHTNNDLLDEDTTFFTQPRKAVSSIAAVFSSLGLWCGLCSTEIILSEVQKLLKKNLNNQNELIKVENVLLHVNRKCNEAMQENNLENLYCCVSPQLLLLIQILEETAKCYDSSINGQEHNLKEQYAFSGIIFVKQRIFAYTICEWLKEVSKNDPKYSFIKPNYIVGHGIQQRMHFSVASSMSYKKQQATIKDFRQKNFNFLVATSVIEEGLDIPKCNLVIRFDLPEDFRAYVQSKGRARAKEAKYILMTSCDEKEKLLNNLKDFKLIENILMKYCHQRTETSEDMPHPIDDDILPPYMPVKKDGAPRITMTSAISLINRYCAKLPCDKTSRLVPHWRLETVHLNCDVNSSDLGYICLLRLPPNSPLNKIVASHVMSVKRHAKMAAALKACEELHKIGELDENLLPIGDNIDKYKHEVVDKFDDEKDKKKTGRKKTIQAYEKKIPDLLQKSLPTEHDTCFLYTVHMKFSSVNNLGILRDAENVENGTSEYGILTTKQFPTFFGFPVFTAKTALKIDINIESVKTCMKFSNDQLCAIQVFHQYIFTEILQIDTKRFQFDPKTAEFSLYIVPIIKNDECNSNGIDWNLINLVCCHVNTEKQELIKRNKNVINSKSYDDAVIYTWYNDTRRKHFFYVNEILHQKSPLSCFPSKEYKNYKQYFNDKYSVEIENENQFLLSCGYINNTFCTKITSRYSDQYGKSLKKSSIEKLKKQTIVNLVPELCIIIPLSYSFFRKILTLPSVLYRLSSYIQADQFRFIIAKEANIGLAELPPDFKWPTFEYNNYHQKSSENLSNLQNAVNNRNSQISTEKIKLGKCEVSKINLDYQEDLSNYCGPNPEEILAAFTLIRSQDYFNLERLEIIGDSFLKYSVSVNLYLKYNLDEGKLTQLKALIVSNYNLYQLSKSKNLEKCIIGQKFDFKRNWLPPCFTVKKKENTTKNISTGITDQNLSDKSLADSVEALIGVYLLNCGFHGALKFMSWLNFKIFDGVSLNSNYLPMEIETIDGTEGERKLSIHPKHYEFEKLKMKKFEEKIGYTFKEKLYLLEALTHASYYEKGRNYNCYQRLEFLGDAVLDYIITRYLYEDPRKHMPGVLTDLRAALVNNRTFAVLAVKQKFHKYLQSNSENLFKVIDRFVTKVMESENIQDFLNETEQMDDIYEIEVPKPLSDIFESVAGAIYIDSGMSLETVWDVYYPMMKSSFDICDNIPKSFVRQLYELYPKTKFSKPKPMDDGSVKVTVTVNGNIEFEGFGANKTVAKKAAAKMALNSLKKIL
ncbi:endoribonuclease Dicer-like isoform X2 [Centruroides sculpturatus]|uniref:endoribonuclease Dicer-like isoform X2 n=1 Tax=Centruroides sculpturatus TaxID=218467 RepID=UPI000C6DE930|nr:endoribonuclease Dicer-like isoform X2 [Centruroides sculpturatus]